MAGALADNLEAAFNSQPQESILLEPLKIEVARVALDLFDRLQYVIQALGRGGFGH